MWKLEPRIHMVSRKLLLFNVRYKRSRNNGVENCENMLTVDIGQVWLAGNFAEKCKHFPPMDAFAAREILACVICFPKSLIYFN